MEDKKAKFPYYRLAREGLSSLLYNIFHYLNILKVPMLCNITAFVILFTIKDSFTPQNTAPSSFAIISLFFSILLFIYTFWKQLLCFGAVSYFEKDVYDGKELQPAKMYYQYIQKYQGRFFLLFLLVLILLFCTFLLLGIVLAVYFGFFVFICSFLPTIAQVIAWIFAIVVIIPVFLQFILPFFVGLYFSYTYFFYEDKSSVINVVKKSVKLCYKNRDLTSVIILILLFVGIVNAIINVISLILGKIGNLFVFVSASLDIFGIVFGCILSYVPIFIITTIYLEMKKQGMDKV